MTMSRNYLLWCLLGISSSLIGDTNAIVGGKKASDKQLPYQVSILYFGIGHECGGGILSEYYVVTAAYCVVRSNNHIDRRQIFVLAGTVDLHKTHRPAQTIKVDRIYVPADYTPRIEAAPSDIAVLKLHEPLILSDHIKALELPRNNKQTYDGHLAEIAGWGWDRVKIEDGKEEGNHSDTILRYAEADVIDREQCQRGYTTLIISKKQICARVKQRGISTVHGACNGDGGSPLVSKGKLIGILNGSPFGCAERESASIYARASEYLDFIHNAMKDKTTNDMRVLIK